MLVVEKEARYGGTTARSGGWLWIPGTRLATEQGIQEPPGAAKAYLKHETTTHFDEKRVDAFLENGPKAIDFFTKQHLRAVRHARGVPRLPRGGAGRAAWRSLDGHAAIRWPRAGRADQAARPAAAGADRLRNDAGLRAGDPAFHARVQVARRRFVYVTKRLSKHFLDVVIHGRGMTLTNGNALAGRLAKAAMDLNIPVWLSSPVKKLVTEHDGVAGAMVEHEGKTITVKARRGVVLACGGFPHDIERRKQLFPHAPTGKEHYSPSPEANTGDGLRLAEAVGGRVDGTIPHAAAWVPASITTRPDGSKGVMPHFIDRAKPGVIAVTPKGKRFTNEGNSYHDFVQAMVKACEGEAEVCAWLLCDHKALRNYGLGCVAPSPLPIGRHLRSGYLKRGATVAELAKQIGIAPATLEATVAEFNASAKLRRRSRVRQGQQSLQPLPRRRAGHAEPLPRSARARTVSTRSSS